METQESQQLVQKSCQPCEGGVEPYSTEDARAQLAQLRDWHMTHDGRRIRRDWTVKNFMAGIEFLNQVAKVAEQEGHHPDVHLEEYRKVWIELWTHAIGGLSENDFILAAKIDEIPVN